MTVKRYLVDERHRIELHDLVTRETEKVFPQLSVSHFAVQSGVTSDELANRLKRYEALTEIIRSITMVGCYWGDKEQSKLWTKMLDRIANPYGPIGGMTVWINLRLYPALLLMYSGGLAAVLAGKYATLYDLLTRPRVRDGSRDHALVTHVNAASEVINWDLMRLLPALKGRSTPVSEYLYRFLRESFREFIPDDFEYEKCFDKFEYMVGLVYVDFVNNGWAPLGLFAFRNRFWRSDISVAVEMKSESEAAGEDWPPLRAGLFSGSAARFKDVQAAFDAFIARVSHL